uniref:Uncharacterized protein n=1 Tax=Panagrolaimus sp. ES5 TaxID=591445 RepID=A0AC34G7G2_9BILA
MSTNAECWGKDIKTCAKVVAIIGIVASVLSFNILGLIIYVLVYMGVENRKPSYLLPAKICLIIGLVLSVILIILFIVLGIVAAAKGEQPTPFPQPGPHPPHYGYSPAALVLGFITFLISTAYLIISYIVVDKAEKHLHENHCVAEI